ncbi:metal ABC transporter solute-binding protein, Zn/Mn family [Clostridium intestinale]|jgi:zinc transport system substrate-binding protein|uniref:Metal-binding protein n=2 Tax=Clostridium intestinale TaxID=36845 RepID=U2NS81_9CLOT|nr:zinc ABC transporter substrate-binding protein [Clostridium intestinale]ERK31716.1 metal-binding protein [Clostridium intestinale URNW]QLY78865.1 zinc ABC transporter substrate-binding protein [Clostridium intestinale]
MNKKFLSAMVLALSVSILGGCATKTNKADSGNKDDKVKVIVSFNPLKEFVEAVGKDKVDVQTVIPEGTEPHDFEPKAKDMEAISKADIFVYNGLGMEEWVEKTLEAVDNKELSIVVASDNIDPIKNEDEHADEHEEEAGEEHEHGEFDPHTWLSLQSAKIEAENIKNALVKVDETNKDFYEANYTEFAAELDTLYNDYKTKFDSVSNKVFVTGHAAFGYLCRDFGLEQNSVEDVFAEGEPTPQKLEKLIEYSKTHKVKTIFMEELASPKVSETLAKEVGATVEKIYTIESKEDNKNYIESMKDNLEKIYKSLK